MNTAAIPTPGTARPFHRSLPLIRAELQPLAPYVLTCVFACAALVGVVIWARTANPEPAYYLLLMGVCAGVFLVGSGAIALQPFASVLREGTMRQLLAQPTSRETMWLRKAGGSFLASAVVTLVAMFAAWCLILFAPGLFQERLLPLFLGTALSVHFLVLCSTGSVLSLYFKGGGGLMALFFCVGIFWSTISLIPELLRDTFNEFALVMIQREMLGVTAFVWMPAVAWSGAAWLLSLNLFRRLEV